MVGGTVQRQDHQRQQQRYTELDANRNIGLAQSRQQHHHGADAGEHQHEGGGEGGKQRDIDAHDLPIMHQPPMIRDDIRIMWLCSASAMNGSASISVTKIARIFGTNTSVCSWIWVSAWNSDTTTPTTRPTTISGDETITMVQIASRATSRVSAPVMTLPHLCLLFRHSGAMRSIEPGISRFMVLRTIPE